MEITITLSSTTFRVPVSDTGLETVLDLSKIPADVHAKALVNGYIGALNNIARSNGKGEEPKTDKQWAKARADKVAVWESGEWAVHGGGGERDVLPLRDAFYEERGAADNKARKQVDKAIRAKVAEAFGKDESATFGRFLDAVAIEIGKARGEEPATVRDQLEAKYTKLALELVKKRNSAVAKIDVSNLL